MFKEDLIEIRWYFSVIRRWFWLIVSCVLLGGSTAFAVTSWLPPRYSASAILLVNVASGNTTSDYNAIYASERLGLTYSQMLTQRWLMEAVIERLKLTETPDLLAKKVKAMPIKDTQLIQLSVEDTDPAKAALIANTIAETFVAQIKTLRQVRQQGNVKVSIAERSVVPQNPVRGVPLYTALAMLVSGMLALGTAFLLEQLDDTIKNPDDVAGALDLSILGAIGRLAKREPELTVITQPLSPVSEAFHMAGANIRFASTNKSLRTLLVTSPCPGEGKSFTVANLAAAMAQTGLKVTAVDADLRRPRLPQLFGLDHLGQTAGKNTAGGLTKSLREGCLNGWLQPTELEELKLLPTGELPPNPIGLLSSQQMRKLLHGLAQQADMVLVDSPPVLAVADVAVLAQVVDGVLLVLEAGHTSRAAAKQAVESLRQVGANLVGVVLNGVSTDKGSYYHYHYQYYRDGDKQRKQSPH